MVLKIQAGDYKDMGVKRCADRSIFTFQCPKEIACAVLLFDKKTGERVERIEVTEKYCVGAVRSVAVSPLKTERYNYAYEIDGKIMRDPYARRVVGREKWGDLTRNLKKEQLLSGFVKNEFDWECDENPEIAAENMVMYKLHVRGFSMDDRGRKRGTFSAVQDKLSYLKGLGITSVEVMPVYEFEELMESKEGELKINYWGYTESDYFAVKSSYAYGKDAGVEFKTLIKQLHAKGMELIMEIHFDSEQTVSFMTEVLRYWVMEYHVDGFKLLGAALPMEGIARDPYLSRTKLFYENFSKELLEEEPSNLYAYNEEFLYPARKMLNHLSGDMIEFTEQLKKSHPAQHFVNYIANNNTFTLADIFSYNEKHNMENIWQRKY